MKKYFLGWYFKNTSKNHNLALIPGIAISGKNKTAFIQVINDSTSFYISYPYESFKYQKKPFYVQIGNSYFSKEKVRLDINEQNLKLTGELFYQNIIKPQTSLYAPTIMGPFSYIPRMQCKHGILSLHHQINGNLRLNNKNIIFNNGTGYIEKDSGTSFPQKYFWLQTNNFKTDTVSLMVAGATIPFGLFKFTGLISILYINGLEYRFTTYNNSKIKNIQKQKNKYLIKLQNGQYNLEIIVLAKNGQQLKAPDGGLMNQTVKEALGCIIKLNLKNKTGKSIYKGVSSGGFEWQF